MRVSQVLFAFISFGKIQFIAIGSEKAAFLKIKKILTKKRTKHVFCRCLIIYSIPQAD